MSPPYTGMAAFCEGSHLPGPYLQPTEVNLSRVLLSTSVLSGIYQCPRSPTTALIVLIPGPGNHYQVFKEGAVILFLFKLVMWCEP